MNLILKIIIRGKELRRIAAVVAALMLPVQVLALGVSDIEWSSALNQPLKAEIGLFAAGSTSQHDINVKLAPYEAYERAGVEYPSILRELKFSVERRDSGELYIKLTSTNAIKDPFLDILIEIDWPSGHLLREYTVLLDLPVMTDEVAGPVSSPMTSMFMPDRSDTTSGMPSDMSSDVTAVEGDQSTAATAAPMSAAPIYGESNSRAGADGLRYGMVKRGDTLWGIAESMRTDKSVSVQQIMMALLKNNPKAFYDNNINNLKAGYVLRLDDSSLLTKMSQSEAAREAQRHYQSWMAAKKGGAIATATAQTDSAAKGTSVGAGAETGTDGPSLKLVSPEEADVAMTSKSTGGDGQSRSFTSKELDTLRQELTYAMEASDAGRQENTQLHARIAELEEQIGKMQRLLSLRDDALSVLQVQPKDGAQALAEPEVPVEVVSDAAPGAASIPSTETAEQMAADDEAVVPATTEAAAPAAIQPAAPPPVKPGVKFAKPVQSAAPEEGVIDIVLGYVNKAVAVVSSFVSPMLLGGVVGGALILGGGFWFLRRRKISGDDLEQSMMIEVADKQLSEDMANGTASDLSESKEETSAVDLLDTTNADNIETDIDEIDVLAEADVYLAYQRFDRAEELLREAVEHEPRRYDLMLKLMEVFVASGNKDGFIEIAERCNANGGQEDGELWSKVVVMGSKIAASHALFSSSSSAADADADADDDDSDIPGGDLGAGFDDDDLLAGLDLNLGSDTQEDNTTAVDNLSSELDDLDFGNDDQSGMDVAAGQAELDDDVPVAESVPVVENKAAADDNSLSFDVSDLSMDSDAPADSEMIEMDTATVAEHDGGLEFDGGLDMAMDDKPATEVITETVADNAAVDDNALDFDLSGLSMDGETSAVSDTVTPAADDDEIPVSFAADRNDSAIGAELSDDIDWLTSVADDAVDNDDNGSSFFSSEDEVATKLDLIRAYIDMGDKDSARNILSEVVEEGSDDQKKEAKELLRQIG